MLDLDGSLVAEDLSPEDSHIFLPPGTLDLDYHLPPFILAGGGLGFGLYLTR